MEPTQKSFSLTVRPIACSFPWKIHVDARKLKEMSDAWLLNLCKSMPAACRSQRAAFFFSPGYLVDSELHLLTMLFFGNAPPSSPLLLPIVKHLSWDFILDNFLDDPSEMGVDPVQAKLVVESIVALFEPAAAEIACTQHDQPGRAQVKEAAVTPVTVLGHGELGLDEDDGFLHSLTVSAAEWWEEIRPYMSLSQQSRFRAIFVDYLRSNHEQALIRASPHPPSLQTYLHIRGASIGWYALALLTECCHGIDLDAELLTHPLLCSLHRNVCEHIILVNDIISFGREYMQGDLFNVVSVLCFSKFSLPPSIYCEAAKVQALLSQEMLQEAVLQVSEMIKERDRGCQRLMQEIRRCPMFISKPRMEDYLHGLGLFVGGNVYWHLVSGRYGLSQTAPDLLAPLHLQFSLPNCE